MADKQALHEWRAVKARIPGWFAFGRTYDLAVANAADGATFVEVGSWKGRSAYYMAAKIPDAEKVVIPAAGHAANIDQPKAFNEAVLSFLDRLDGRQQQKAAS